MLVTSEFLRKINKETKVENADSKAMNLKGSGTEAVKSTESNVIYRSYWDFTSKPADITLVVEEKKLYVHKVLLTQSSPVFKVMLESESFIEKDQKKIELPDKKKDEIQEMLNFLYPFDHEITEKTSIESLLNLSREYQIQKIKDMCEDFLLLKDCSIEMFLVAQEYDLKKLKEKCIGYFEGVPLVKMESFPCFSEVNDENCAIIHKLQLTNLQAHYEKIIEEKNRSGNCGCCACRYIKENINNLKGKN